MDEVGWRKPVILVHARVIEHRHDHSPKSFGSHNRMLSFIFIFTV
jgi:hypothetical protein